MQKDKEQRNLVDEFLERRDFASKYSTYKNIDVDAAFSRFSKKVGIEERSRHKSIIGWTIGIAASIAIIISIGIAVLTADGNNDKQYLANISPGYAHAFITTADGSRMELTGESALVDTVSMMQNDDDVADNSLVIVEVPRGGEYRITLSDGTQVHLNSESSIEFPRKFSGNARNVKLKGEACFEVAHIDNQPFVVDAYGVKVKEYGTSFNVQAYSNNRVEVTLAKGSIGVIVPFRGESQLTPGRQAVVCGNNINIHDVDIDNVYGWSEGLFRFDDDELADIAEILSRWYDVNIVVDNSISHSRFTGTIERDGKISDILDAIAEITGMKYSNDNSNIRIHR